MNYFDIYRKTSAPGHRSSAKLGAVAVHKCRVVSWHDKQQASIRLKVMRLISVNPEISTRQVADGVGVSNGSAYYVLTALVEKGFVKLRNFRNNSRKGQYACLLTHSINECNRQKFEDLGAEIQAIEPVVGLTSEAIMTSRGGK